MMDTKNLHEFLIKQLGNLEGISTPGFFKENSPPQGDITTVSIGSWLWVKARLVYRGATWDESTDRVLGDPYEAHVWHDWIGKIVSAPESVSSPEELDEWALIKTYYLCEYTDIGIWGRHKGSYIVNLLEDGTMTIRTAKGVFHDVPPESMTEVEITKIEQK